MSGWGSPFSCDIVRQFNYNKDDVDKHSHSDNGVHDKDSSNDDHDKDGQVLVHAPMHDV